MKTINSISKLPFFRAVNTQEPGKPQERNFFLQNVNFPTFSNIFQQNMCFLLEC